MAVELHLSGPGIDERHLLVAGQDELVVGRDADCGICLPDPRRNVSRRHLAVWCEADELHFRVLSVVNGVELPFGEAPPGARGVLPYGQMLKLGDYKLLGAHVPNAPAQPADADGTDPWAVLEREASGFGPSVQPRAAAPVPPATFAAAASGPARADDDPFGEWGFDSTYGPGSRAGAALNALAQPGDGLAAFFRGVGLDAQQLGPLSDGELEEAGRLVRQALLGLLGLHAARAELKRDLRAEDRTMLASSGANPLKEELPAQSHLQYLLGGRAASAGFVRPERALDELLAELLAHDQAMGVAARAVVDGTLREFAPSALKTQLLGGGSRLFEGTRLWDAYVKHHDEQGADMTRWLERLFGKYFTAAYMRETARLKRESTTRPPR